MALLARAGEAKGPMQAEPGHYDFAPYRGRPRINWPGGARIAVWVVPNIEHYELDPPANPMRGGWFRPTPDVLAYSWRDYGNRAGFDRMADVMARHGVRGSVSLNVAVCDMFPDIIARCCELGWELFSHGVYNTRYMYGMDEAQQRALIGDVRETILRASGQRLDGWLSPALSNDDLTQHILAEEGILYTLDMLHDDQPMPVRTRSGRPLISIPYSLEVNDVPQFVLRNATADEWVDVVLAQFEQLRTEGDTVLCLPIHPYIVGAPHRIGGLDRVLGHIAAQPDVWLATGREIARHFIDHHLAEFEAWIAQGTPA
ncbi:MAG: polysaccharide deacetylase family protein [Alphaproteobacteria bacterium]|nr:polysaccharide deacetylase family protein [Alphaproteobacteria bacterium]